LAEIDYASSIWSLTRKLSRQYDKAQYARVILPFTLLRYLECSLRETKPKVLKLAAKKNLVGKIRVEKLKQAAGFDYYNSSTLDLESAIEDPDLARKQLQSYLNGFSSNIRDVFNGYDFVNEITRLDDADLLIPITRQFLEFDFSSKALSPEKVAAVFDELASRCLNQSIGTAQLWISSCQSSYI
jgi:type I restriction enzyme M protein